MTTPILHLGIEEIKKETFAVHMPVGKFTTEEHQHSRHQLLYAEGGVLHFFTTDQQFILPARHAAWIPANLTHKVASPSPQLYLRTLFIGHNAGRQGFPKQLTVFPVTSLAREMISYTQCWSYENPLSTAEDAFMTAIFSLVPDWCRVPFPLTLPTTQHQLLGNITAYLVENLDDDLTNAKVSREFGVSTRTMMRLFRDQLDMTFGEYLRTARIITALELLSSRDTPITEIALQVGYQSMSSFSQTFKAFSGKSPSVFRNEMK